MEALQMKMIQKGLYKKVILTSIFPYSVKTGLIEDLEEPFSTFYDVVPLEECADSVVDAILKEKQTQFIPGGIGILYRYLKCFTTKAILPYARKVFNFSYEPRKKLNSSDVIEV